MQIVNYSKSLHLGETTRNSFFDASIKRLQSATKDGFHTFQRQCQVEQNLYDSTYPTVMMSAEADKFEGLKEDQPSVELLPVDYSTCVPVKVVGDGNCLYR